MSMFSSLSYLLKRASFGLGQATTTGPTSNFIPEENQFTNNLSYASGNKSYAINNISGAEYPLLITAFSNEAEINNLFYNSTIKLKNFIGLPTSEGEYKSESDVQFPNVTYHDANPLFEIWWNIFAARYLRHGWGWTITLIIAYLLILVVGVIGNLMVILVVSLRPQMRTVTNMFIVNLAVADLFFVVFCVPSTLLANIFSRKLFSYCLSIVANNPCWNQLAVCRYILWLIFFFWLLAWILGTFLCKALAYVQGVSVCASAYSLAAISIDRCQAIYRNLERPRGFSRATCITIVFIIWLAAVSLTIPWAIRFNVKMSEYDGLRYCVETWKVEKFGTIYFLIVNLLCFYAIPLLVIFVSNWLIYFQVTHRKVPQDSSVTSAPIRKMHRQTRHDVLKMLAIVTFTFLFSWLPLYTLVIVIKFTKHMNEWEYTMLGVLMPIAQWLGSWNSSMNPILYAFLNKKFRRMLKSILPSWIPLKAAGKHQCQSRFVRSRSRRASKTAYHCQFINGQTNNFNDTSQLVATCQEKMGTVATTVMQNSPNSSLTSLGFLSRTTENVFHSDETNINKNITEL